MEKPESPRRISQTYKVTTLDTVPSDETTFMITSFGTTCKTIQIPKTKSQMCCSENVDNFDVLTFRNLPLVTKMKSLQNNDTSKPNPF